MKQEMITIQNEIEESLSLEDIEEESRAPSDSYDDSCQDDVYYDNIISIELKIINTQENIKGVQNER